MKASPEKTESTRFKVGSNSPVKVSVVPDRRQSPKGKGQVDSAPKKPAAVRTLKDHRENSRKTPKPAIEPAGEASLDKGSATSGSENFNKVEILLAMETEIRKAESLAELKYLITNESKKLVAADLVMFHKSNGKNRLKEVEVVSSLATLDSNAPLLIWVNSEVGKSVDLKRDSKTSKKHEGHKHFTLNIENAPGSNFPFAYGICIPMWSPKGLLLGATTYLKETPFEEADTAFADRIAETSAHALNALRPRRSFWARLFTKPIAVLSFWIIVLAMFLPVTLTVLAPVEIAPHKPAVVASPLTGVIDSMDVLPNSRVKKDQLLFKLNKVELLNKFEVAARNVAVAEARYRRATQGSFRSAESKRELAVTKAEHEMAVAERDHAAARLAQSEVRASRDGIALYSGQEDWTGKPVVTGERVMRIADPNHIRMRIELEADDAIILDDGAEVSAFFDSDPLQPVKAKLETQSYQAETTDANVLVFPITAVISDEQKANYRIGLRGTAQIYGSKVPLWFYLFRKPISAIRQRIGI